MMANHSECCDMPIRIVLADDHLSYRAAIREMLDREPGIEIVAEASDGEIAVQASLAHEPDVVLIDIAMPCMDGIEATRRIVAHRRHPQVIALTLHAELSFVRAMLSAGARGYLLKGDAYSDLLRAIREVAAGGQFISANVDSPGIRGAADV
ncbi:MAG: response regulator transcription factor [Burkholderiales bacterium]